MTNDKFKKVVDLLLNKKELLSYTEEDSKLLLKLWNAYWNKRKGNLRSSPEVLAAALLWEYSSDNYLWESDENWTQKKLAELFLVKGKPLEKTPGK
jgi:hypothetical protein